MSFSDFSFVFKYNSSRIEIGNNENRGTRKISDLTQVPSESGAQSEVSVACFLILDPAYILLTQLKELDSYFSSEGSDM